MKKPPNKIQCRTCGRWLTQYAFYQSRGRRPYGLSSQCRECTRERLDRIGKRVLTDEEKYLRYRKHNIKKKFGLSLEEYDALLEKANGVCQICKRPETKKHQATGEVQPLSIDHDSVTGAIRGLLCSACNFGIGHLKHDPSLLRSAIEYLETTNIVVVDDDEYII